MSSAPRGGRAFAAVVARLLAAVAVLCGLLPALPLSAADPPLTACAFTPGGGQVLLGSQAGLQLMRWPELNVERTLPSPCDQIHDVAFAPDGSQLAVAGGIPGSRGEVVLLSWPDLVERQRAIVLEDLIYRVAWSPDGSRLAAVGASREVAVCDAELGNRLKLTGHSGHVLAVTFVADANVLVTAGVDRSLRVWDVAERKLVRSMENHTATVTDLAVRPVGSAGPVWVASAGEDATIRLWQPTIGRMMRFARLAADPLAIAWTPDGQAIVAACRDGRVRLVDPTSVTTSSDQPALTGWPYALAVEPSLTGPPTDERRRALVVGERHGRVLVEFGPRGAE